MKTTLVYPLKLTASGDLATTSDYPELVRQAILHSIQTIKGELVYYPQSGRDFLVWNPVTSVADILASLRDTIRDSLTGYPGVTFSLLGGFGDEGTLDLLVRYTCPDSDPLELRSVITL